MGSGKTFMSESHGILLLGHHQIETTLTYAYTGNGLGKEQLCNTRKLKTNAKSRKRNSPFYLRNLNDLRDWDEKPDTTFKQCETTKSFY